MVKEKVNKAVRPQQAWIIAFGTNPPDGKLFCPFHANHRSPAAKLYDYGLRCFGLCNRVYTSYDILKKFAPSALEKILESKLEQTATKRIKIFSGTTLKYTIESYYGTKI